MNREETLKLRHQNQRNIFFGEFKGWIRMFYSQPDGNWGWPANRYLDPSRVLLLQLLLVVVVGHY